VYGYEFLTDYFVSLNDSSVTFFFKVYFLTFNYLCVCVCVVCLLVCVCLCVCVSVCVCVCVGVYTYEHDVQESQ